MLSHLGHCPGPDLFLGGINEGGCSLGEVEIGEVLRDWPSRFRIQFDPGCLSDVSLFTLLSNLSTSPHRVLNTSVLVRR